MNKKIVAIIGLCAVAALGLTACGGSDKGVYDTLNKLSKGEYASIKLSVTTTLDDATLTGSYKATAVDGAMRVEYSYERMNTIVKNEDGSYTVPDEMKSTCAGTGIVSDGKFTLEGGEEVDVSAQMLTAFGLKFVKRNFSNVVTGDGKFTADVNDASLFLSRHVTCAVMEVEVEYSTKSLKTVKISYTSQEGANVVLWYAFE